MHSSIMSGNMPGARPMGCMGTGELSSRELRALLDPAPPQPLEVRPKVESPSWECRGKLSSASRGLAGPLLPCGEPMGDWEGEGHPRSKPLLPEEGRPGTRSRPPAAFRCGPCKAAAL